MSMINPAECFFGNDRLPLSKAQRMVEEGLSGFDDGELFLEECYSESFSFDDGVLRNANYDTEHGFGFRGIIGEASGYAHSSDFTEAALKQAIASVGAVKAGHTGVMAFGGAGKVEKHYYPFANPLQDLSVQSKIAVLQQIDAYVRNKEKNASQVSISLAGECQVVGIIKPGLEPVYDVRPLVRLNISVIVQKDGRMERGSYGMGGRDYYASFLKPERWQAAADEAIRQAKVNLDAVEAPAGEMDVVLGPGWPGVLLHEAIGHGLEGDFNRKRTSAFSGLMGERVAAKGVTVVDDGTLSGRRGSLNVDDEGTPTNCTTLIEDGILTGYMQDRTNARLMNMRPTGNGRRESYEYQPLPRMTNTYMLSGDKTHEEIIASVKKGLYAPNFGGGQVDITSGKFVFAASEAYKIENGKITVPVKGATLIGNGPDILTKVKMIGNNMALDDGVGTCGKDGQGVPVGVGQPSLLVAGLTIGGTEVM